MPTTCIKRGLELIEKEGSKVLELKIGNNILINPRIYVPKANKNIRNEIHYIYNVIVNVDKILYVFTNESGVYIEVSCKRSDLVCERKTRDVDFVAG